MTPRGALVSCCPLPTELGPEPVLLERPEGVIATAPLRFTPIRSSRYTLQASPTSRDLLSSLQARAKELRLELLNSERLKAHFEAHPGDLALLRHDKPLHRAPPPAHLKHLPAYLQDPATAAVQQDGSTKRGVHDRLNFQVQVPSFRCRRTGTCVSARTKERLGMKHSS